MVESLALLAPISYVLAGLLFLVLAVLVATGWRRKMQTGLLLLAALVSTVWALVLGVQTVTGIFRVEVLFVLEVLRNAVWLAFLVAVLKPAGEVALSKTLQTGAYFVPPVMLAYGLLQGPETVFITGGIVLCLLGLALVERIYGSTDPAVRRPIGYLCLALGGMFAYDLVLYSSAVLIGQIEPGLWAARAMANVVIVPFIAVAARGNRDWPVDMFVSRQVAYFSVTFFGAGIYLLLMAIGAYYVKQFGGDWGSALQAIVLFGAFMLLVTVLLSDRFRRRARVFFSKHFFRNRYDYREEWRRLAHVLYHPDESRSAAERGIEATARILESKSGLLLLRGEDEGSEYRPVAAWRCELPDSNVILPDSSLVEFVVRTSWVIDTRQYCNDKAFYEGLELPEWLGSCDDQEFIVPLFNEADLIGFVVMRQDTPVELTYEDTDLLKIVGRQVAGVLAQQQASDRLAEGKQFEAYSRLTAFLMHDLKNVAAQQALVVKNAEKHKHNPEFVEDAFATIEHSVNRINGLIAQLAERNRKTQLKKVNATTILSAAIERTQDRNPKPRGTITTDEAPVSADKDRLFAVFNHVIRNAQDACDAEGSITVSADVVDGAFEVRIDDTGVGMNDTFIRERLFRPFESTKGVDGMGIGAYQAREYVREMQGDMQVKSAPGEGTSVRIRLPLSAEPAGVARTGELAAEGE